MKLYCPRCLDEKVKPKQVLEIAGYPTKKPLYCSRCNKAYSYSEVIKKNHD